MIFRKGQLEDLQSMQQLFVDTIKNSCQADYNEEQIEVWTASIENTPRWLAIITQQIVVVAEDKGKIVGFASLDNGNYIDLMYVHHAHQRQGIAQQLYKELATTALEAGHTQLYSDISKTARPFFESIGFKVVTEQTVIRKGITLNNFKMVKNLLPTI